MDKGKDRTSGFDSKFLLLPPMLVCSDHSAPLCLRFIKPSRGVVILQHTVERISGHHTREVFVSQTGRPSSLKPVSDSYSSRVTILLVFTNYYPKLGKIQDGMSS